LVDRFEEVEDHVVGLEAEEVEVRHVLRPRWVEYQQSIFQCRVKYFKFLDALDKRAEAVD